VNIKIITPPGHPVSIAEAKQYCRAPDGSEEDALFEILLAASRREIETLTGRAIGEQTIQLTADRFPRLSNFAHLPRAPLTEVIKVEYLNTQGELVLFEDFVPVTDSEPGGIYAPDGFPDTLYRPDAVRITYKAGGEVSEDLMKAILWLTSHAYEHRDPAIVGTSVSELPFALQSVISLNKVHWRWPS
jgi:uncharacterized phiE125 gp8 family phage protein